MSRFRIFQRSNLDQIGVKLGGRIPDSIAHPRKFALWIFSLWRRVVDRRGPDFGLAELDPILIILS